MLEHVRCGVLQAFWPHNFLLIKSGNLRDLKHWTHWKHQPRFWKKNFNLWAEAICGQMVRGYLWKVAICGQRLFAARVYLRQEAICGKWLFCGQTLTLLKTSTAFLKEKIVSEYYKITNIPWETSNIEHTKTSTTPKHRPYKNIDHAKTLTTVPLAPHTVYFWSQQTEVASAVNSLSVT